MKSGVEFDRCFGAAAFRSTGPPEALDGTGSTISIASSGRTSLMTLRAPLLQTTSIDNRFVIDPAAKVRSASSLERYRPPQIISWLWAGTAPSRTVMRAPIPLVLGGAPRRRTAILGAAALFR